MPNVVTNPGGRSRPLTRSQTEDAAETETETEHERRRESLIFDEGPTEINDVKGLLDWIRADPQSAWNILVKRHHEVDELRQLLQEEEASSKARVVKRDDVIRELRDELEEHRNAAVGAEAIDDLEAEYQRLNNEKITIEKQLAEVTKERDGLATSLRYLGSSQDFLRASPTLADNTRRSAKMPDAPMLDDGKTIKFKAWKNEIRSKLLLNEDHYPTASHQLAYVRSRCEGKALRHVSPRMQPDASKPYQTIDDVFNHLESVFHDPNHKQVARDQYLELKMSPKQDFTDFLAEFVHLAEESEQPTELRKRDLYRMIPILMQNQTMMACGKDDVDFDEYVQLCHIASRLIDQQQTNRAQNRARTSVGTVTAAAGKTTTGTTTSTTRSSYSTLSPAERVALMKEGKCFKCKQAGHLSRECPNRVSKTTELKTLEDDENDTQISDNQSGKAEA